MSWSSAKSNNQAQNYQSDYHTNFDTREPKLKLTEYFDPEIVDNDDQNKQDRDPNPWVHFFPGYPVSTGQTRQKGDILHNECCCSESKFVSKSQNESMKSTDWVCAG